MRLVAGWDLAVSRWVGDQLDIDDFGPCTAIGFAEGDELIAGVVYNWYDPPDIRGTIASTSPKWCTRQSLRIIFTYPFVQLNCRRITAVTEVENQPARAFLCRTGFVEEGVLRQRFTSGDAVVYGMLREECRWLGISKNVLRNKAEDA